MLTLCPMTAAFADGPDGPMVIKRKIACVGDSLTQGTASSNEATKSYPAQLQGLVDASSCEIQNFGASGFAAMKSYNRGWIYWDHPNFKKSHDYQPDIVIMMLGTNDIIHASFDQNYVTDMTALIQSYKELESKPTVYLVTAPVAHDSRAQDLQDKLIPAQKQIAQDTGCILVDLNAETASWDKSTDYAPDGLHFSDAGYLKLAKFFYEKIFDGKLYTLTVKCAKGVTVSLAGQSGDFIETGNGKKTVTASNGTVSVPFEITVKGNTTLDLGDTTLEPGTSFSPTVTYEQTGTPSQPDEQTSQPKETQSGPGGWLIYAILGALAVAVIVAAVVFAVKRK